MVMKIFLAFTPAFPLRTFGLEMKSAIPARTRLPRSIVAVGGPRDQVRVALVPAKFNLMTKSCELRLDRCQSAVAYKRTSICLTLCTNVFFILFNYIM